MDPPIAEDRSPRQDSMIRGRPIRFLLVGALNTVLGYAVYCLSLYAGLSVPRASLVAIVFGVIVSFLTQGFVVFGNATGTALLRFIVNWGIMYAVYVGVVAALQTVGLSPYVGGLVASGATTAASYFILRDFVFRGPTSSRGGDR